MALPFKLHLEIPFLLIFYSFMVSEFVTTNFLLYRTCYVTLGYNITDCALLGTKNATDEIKKLEPIVQKHVTVIVMTYTIISSVIPVFCSLIIGPWSNHHGRKPILLSSFIGYFLSYIFVIIFTLLPWASPWWWVIASIVSSLGGGVCSMITVCFCYIVDTTSEDNRGIRIGIIEAVFSIGAIAGTLSTSYLFDSIGYLGIYILCACVVFISIVYIYYFVPESVKEIQSQNALKDLVDVSVILKIFKTCVKPRANMDRALLSLLMTMMTVYIFVIFSDSAVFYLYIREKFHWPLEQYSLYTSVNNSVEIFLSMFLLVVLCKYCKLNEMVVVLFGFVSLTTSSIFFGLATKTWHIYLASGIKRFSCANGILGRSEISKIIPPDDLGSIFALTTSLETVMQLISSPVYTLLYNSTVNTVPGAFNFLSASMYSLNIFVVSVVIFIRRLYPSTNLRVINES